MKQRKIIKTFKPSFIDAYDYLLLISLNSKLNKLGINERAPNTVRQPIPNEHKKYYNI